LLLLWSDDPLRISSPDAKTELIRIGARLVAFDEAEPFAAPFIRWFGYRPKEAGAALMIIADKPSDVFGKFYSEYAIARTALKILQPVAATTIHKPSNAGHPKNDWN
jgi:hypothetical protein